MTEAFLRKIGFVGFQTVGYYKDHLKEIPEQKGVYVVSNKQEGRPTFVGCGDYERFNELFDNWISNAEILYIGQSKNLKKRIEQYIKKRNNHRGGHSIWKLSNFQDLIICWHPLCDDSDPRKFEKFLIDLFVLMYDKLPFANKHR